MTKKQKNELLEEIQDKPMFFKYLPYEDGKEENYTSTNIACSMISKRGKGGSFGVKAAFSIRVDPAMLHLIDIAAARAETSRNEMITMILESGFQAIMERLSEEDKRSLLDEYYSKPFRGTLISSGD